MPTAAAPPAVPAAPPVLADVPGLLESSRPKAVVRQVMRGILVVWAVTLVGIGIGLNAAALEAVALIVTVGGSLFVLSAGAGLRREAAALDHLQAMLALHRPEDAAGVLHGLMSRPMGTPEHRLAAMLLLGGTLARLGRHDDALAVYDALVDEGVGGPGAAVLRTARAMEMLRADHLYDADRAISDLRRLVGRGPAASNAPKTPDDADAPPAIPDADVAAVSGLRLVELYRDVKTGHLVEAVESFDANRPTMTAGLGHRVADAYALTALALHRQNRPADAARHYADATALAPASELVRRYPELWPVSQAYKATVPPAIG